MCERFVVRSVTGWRILPGGLGGKEGTDYVVLDSACCYRIIATVNVGQDGHGGNDFRRRKAERLAAKLNAEYP